MSGAPTPAPAVEPQPEGLSYPSRIINVFIAPTKAFTDLKRKSGWWVPFVLIAIVSLLFTAVVDSKITFEKVTENQIKMNASAMERLEKLTPEQRAKQLDISTKITRVISYAFPIPMLVIMLIISALYLATFNFGMGAQLKFGTTLAVVMYAGLPALLKSLLGIVTLFAGVDPDGFMIQNPVATNLAGLVDIAVHPLLYGLLASLDIFKIWTLVLAGIGFSCVSRVKRGASIAAVFGWYIALTVVSLGVSALFM